MSKSGSNNPENREGHSPLRKSGWFLLLGFLFLLIWPYHPESGWNVNTRLNLVFSIVEQGTVAIDAYHDVPPYDTGDKAYFEGHYYSDKIFGVSLLAVPFYSVAYFLNGGEVSFHYGYFLSKAGAVALPGAIAAWLFWLLLARLGTPPRRAVLLTVCAVAGTMWLGYGTLFFPYMPGIAACLAALYLILFPPAGRLTVANCFSVGLLFGGALLGDLTFGLVVLGIGVIWLLRLLDQAGVIGLRAFAEMKGERSRVRSLAGYAAIFWVGVLLPLSAFFIYCYAIFGELSIPYQYEVNPLFREGMSHGFMGIGLPDPAALYFITLHPFRGIFFWSPIILAGLAGCILASRNHGKRQAIGWLGVWCFAAYLFFNAGYYMWWGGWSMGPRLLLPMLPFALLGLGELARADTQSAVPGRRVVRQTVWAATLVLGVVSCALCVPLSLTDPQVPQGNPTEELLDPEFGLEPDIPQFAYLKAFYTGKVNIRPENRLSEIISTQNTFRNVGSILFYLLAGGALLTMAWRMAPAKIRGTDRQDFPFNTRDGTAAPLPPNP